MIIKNHLGGEIFTAHYAPNHQANPNNQPVIVIDETDKSIDPLGYEIIAGREA